jgi:hypothetical protein
MSVVAKADVSERRRSKRSPHVVEAFIASPTSPAERVAVTSVNVSRHGVAFVSPTPVPVGTFHQIDLRLGEQSMRCEVKISHCRQTDAGYDVGGAFC